MKKLAAPALPDTKVPSEARLFGFFSEIRLQASVSLNVRRSTGVAEYKKPSGWRCVEDMQREGAQ